MNVGRKACEFHGFAVGRIAVRRTFYSHFSAPASARLETCARHQVEAPTFTGAARGPRLIAVSSTRRTTRRLWWRTSCSRTDTGRCRQGEKTVLCVQDSSTLNFAKPGKQRCWGSPGPTGPDATSRGLRSQATLAVNADGLPLGFRERRSTLRSRARRRTSSARRSRTSEGLRDSAEAASTSSTRPRKVVVPHCRA